MQTNIQSTNYTLNNIAGYSAEKQEALKIINLLKNYDKLCALGVSIPKGLILSGEPGVGKTLMAKVIAGESGVPFYELEADDDTTPVKSINRIKKLYEEARKNTPAIVFIDELDEIVTSRNFMSDSSRGMVKTLLSEIDGVKSSNGILTIATTNFYQELPNALKRSGRMDKHISFSLPDGKSREEILKLYLSNKNMVDNIDIHMLSKKTSGFSCADLKTLINETLLNVISIGKSIATTKDFIDAIPTVSFKGINKSYNSLEKPSDRVCYHELGHFICEYVLNGNVATISTEQIGGVSGHIRREFFIERETPINIQTFEELKNSAIVCIAGYQAEKIFMGETSTGCYDDFCKFDKTIQLMAWSGMLGPDYLFDTRKEYLPFDEMVDSSFVNNNSEDVRVTCFKEYIEIANTIINDNKVLIEFLFKELKDNRKLESEQVSELIDKFNNKACTK